MVVGAGARRDSDGGGACVRLRDLFPVLGLVLFLFILSPVSAFAHPHVFVDCNLAFVFDANGLAGLQERWVLDEMFAAMIMDEHDANGDGRIQPSEEQSIKTGAFDNLKNFDYFTLVEIDGEFFKPKTARNFSATMQAGKLVYSFFLPCPEAADAKAKTLRVAVRDSGYYADILLDDKTPAQTGGEPFEVQLDMKKVPAWAYYGGQIVPEAAICTFRKAP